MAIRVLKWIGSNGEVLLPLSEETYNNGNLLSTKGTMFFAQTQEVGGATVGQPMGLLLTLTYAS